MKANPFSSVSASRSLRYLPHHLAVKKKNPPREARRWQQAYGTVKAKNGRKGGLVG